MNAAWIPVWLQVGGTLGTIAILIVTHLLNKRSLTKTTNEQTAVITQKQEEIKTGVQEVHVLANDRLTGLLADNQALRAQLVAAGMTPVS